MITGSVLLSPMNTYFKLSDKDFNSNSGACKIDGKSFLCESTKSTKTLSWEQFAKLAKPMLIRAYFEEHICAFPSLKSQ
jgi:hypothetical protein